jgi:signal transduction histidine kinase/ActR/RegA family two-component response regulator
VVAQPTLTNAHIGPLIPAHAILLRYAAAAGITLLVFAIRAALAPLLGVQAPLLPFLLGVLVSAYLGGRGPALLAAGITPVLATVWFTNWPYDAPPFQWLAHVTFFLLLAVLSAFIMQALQEAVRRADESAVRADAAAHALRENDRRKDEFLAMLAHELRNPLTPIRNVAHILGRKPHDGDTVKQASEMLQRQASHLTHLVDDLLDVALITHRRVELKRAAVTVEEVVATAVETVQPLIESRQQSLVVTVTQPGAQVDGDEVRLCQVVSNLLTNASKFSAAGQRIDIAIGGDVREVVVSVRDQGQGIDAQLRPRLFELFMQGDRSLDRAQGGLGVGLTIVKHLVEMHGGQVEAISDGLHRGSEFRVTLPRLGTTRASYSTPGSPVRIVRRRRVLVVDDNADCAQSLRDVLAMDGHEVRVARDGTAALATLDEFAADLVLLDVGLPRMDGYMVAHAIRARFGAGHDHGHGPRPRLVALTGYAREEDKQSALRSGFDEYLRKPVEPDRLLKLVSEDRTPASEPEKLD